jgi:hypothetical protein
LGSGSGVCVSLAVFCWYAGAAYPNRLVGVADGRLPMA